jgi:hypothetical protein
MRYGNASFIEVASNLLATGYKFPYWRETIPTNDATQHTAEHNFSE